METIQVVMDSKLLQAINGAAKRARVNRSALVRTALREHLEHLKRRDLEERDRQGYQQHPDNLAEVVEWESEAAWPER